MFLNKKGFSLLEVLVVIVIISVLAAMATPLYTKVIKKGRASEAVSKVGDIRGAELRYYAEYGSLVTGSNLSALDIEDPNSSGKFEYSVNGSAPSDIEITADGVDSSVKDVCVYYDASIDADIHVDIDNSEGKCN